VATLENQSLEITVAMKQKFQDMCRILTVMDDE
jgi:hypothetical protein